MRIKLNIYIFFPISVGIDKYTPIIPVLGPLFYKPNDTEKEDDYTLMCYEGITKIMLFSLNNNLTSLSQLELSCTEIANNVIGLREEIRLTLQGGLITMSKGPVISENSYINVITHLNDQSKIKNEFFSLNGPMHNEAGFSGFKDIPDVKNFLDILLNVENMVFDNETKIKNLYGITSNFNFYKKEITAATIILRFLTEGYAKAWIELLNLDKHHDGSDLRNSKIRVHNRLLGNYIVYNACRAAGSLDNISKIFINCFLMITLTILLFKIVKYSFKKIISEGEF